MARVTREAVYDYADPLLGLMGRKVKYRKPDGDKFFGWERVTGWTEDGYQWGKRLDGWKPGLYRADELWAAALDGGVVWLCEGEKDADALRERGYLTTSVPNGAGSWDDAWADQLRRFRQVIVMADDDEEGRAHAAHVAVRLLDLLDCAVGVVLPALGLKDAADHLAAGRGRADWRKPSEADARGWLRAPASAATATRTTTPAPAHDAGVWLGKALAKVRSGEARNPTGLWLAAQLRDAGLDYETTEAVLVDEYVPVVNALPGRSTAYRADEAREAVRQAFSRPPRDPAPSAAAPGTEAVESEVRRMRTRHEATELFRAELADKTAVKLPRLTLAEAFAVPRAPVVPERVAELHRVGYNSTITAQYKTGKTTLGGNLLRCLADGDVFLERFDVLKPDGRIGLLNYELSDDDMLDWLTDQGIRDPSRVAVLNLRGVPFSLASPRNQDELVAWCVEMGVEVLHLDPHRRAFAGFGEENNNDDVNRFTATLDEVKKRAGVSDLFLYVHTGRQTGEMGSERARGATALDDWVDQRWLMTKDADTQDRYLYADGRMAFVPEFKLDYDRNTRRLSAAEGNRRTASLDKWKPQLLRALEEAGDAGAKVTTLESRLGVTKNGALKPAIASLLRDGLVVQGQVGTAKPCWLRKHAPKEWQ